jgi:CP family cyanate transporter-like MFS transporter
MQLELTLAQGKAVSWRATTSGAAVGVCALVFLVGVNLRTPLLSVPPVLAIIRANLHLDYSATGLLTSLPSLMMGLGAWPAGRLAGRIGGRLSVALGLAIVTLGTVARGIWPSAIALYVCTAALAAGIALAQTSIPLLARQWFPTRIGFISAIFTDGLTLGETLGAAITVPLMRVWFGDNAWPAALLMWAIPLTVMLLLWLWLAPPAPAPQPSPRVVAASATSQQATDAPKGRSERGISPWVIGAIMGGGSVVYFGMNGWVAPYNEALGANAMTPLALFAINAAQLPICIGLTLMAQQLAGRRWPFVVAGSVSLVAIVGWLVTPPTLEPLWGALIGSSAAAVFTLAIALPAIFGNSAQVARLTGASLGISYTATFIGPYIGGVLWDTFHHPWLAFAPVLVAAVTLLGAALLLPDRPADGARADPAATLAIAE